MIEAITSALPNAGLRELLEHFPGWSVKIIRWRSRFMDPKRREVAAASAIADLVVIPSRVGKMGYAIWCISQPAWAKRRSKSEKSEESFPKVEKD
jgi:hypothetical protein